MYAIYVQNNDGNMPKIIRSFSSKLQALDFLEYTVYRIISSKEGEKRATENIIDIPSPNSRRWGLLPFGYFKTRDIKDSLTKVTIWNKVLKKGLVYNGFHIEKVCHINIIDTSSLYDIKKTEIEPSIMDEEYKEYFAYTVLQQLILKEEEEE